MKKYDSISQLLKDKNLYQGIHIECSPIMSQNIFETFKESFKKEKPSYILETDKGYERDTVKSYLKLFDSISGVNASYKKAIEVFSLTDIQDKKLKYCDLCEIMKINFARISLFNNKICFIEDPLLNLDSKSTQVILTWIAEKYEEGVKFITTNTSLRNALLMPGTVFYLDNNQYVEVQQDIEPTSTSEKDFVVYKIPAKSGNSTLLFDPRDIDYIESMNRANYISVRNSLYQVSQTLDSLEEELKDFGFFRCHRSYIVNMQKVEEIEKWTKNSYSLRLNNTQNSQVPLSKGRIDELKSTFNL